MGAAAGRFFLSFGLVLDFGVAKRGAVDVCLWHVVLFCMPVVTWEYHRLVAFRDGCFGGNPYFFEVLRAGGRFASFYVFDFKPVLEMEISDSAVFVSAFVTFGGALVFETHHWAGFSENRCTKT